MMIHDDKWWWCWLWGTEIHEYHDDQDGDDSNDDESSCFMMMIQIIMIIMMIIIIMPTTMTIIIKKKYHHYRYDENTILFTKRILFKVAEKITSWESAASFAAANWGLWQLYLVWSPCSQNLQAGTPGESNKKNHRNDSKTDRPPLPETNILLT